MEAVIVIIGLAAGYLISSLSKPEMKTGRKYFRLLQAAAFGAIIGVACWQAIGYWSLAAGIAAFGLSWKIPNPVISMPTIALATHYVEANALAFIYTIPSASYEYPKTRRLVIAAILFLAIYYIPF